MGCPLRSPTLFTLKFLIVLKSRIVAKSQTEITEVLGFINSLMVIYGSFTNEKLFDFISAHLWFDLSLYFSLKNFFAGKSFFN